MNPYWAFGDERAATHSAVDVAEDHAALEEKLLDVAQTQLK
jgi:hypothetical protein